ncbi:MAG: hypothetical protein ACFFED_03420 [Candidatus Thorarchaeota archaeon]
MSDEVSRNSLISKESHPSGLFTRIKERLGSLLAKDDTESNVTIARDTHSFDTLAHPVTDVKKKEVSPQTREPSVEQPAQSRSKMHQLYNKYRHLVEERNDINAQKDELTRKVDSGELTTAQTHQKMVALTREASQLTEVLREISERLTELGHPRFKRTG